LKRSITFALSIVIALTLSTTTLADYDSDTDYMAVMIEAVCEGDVEKGTLAQKRRDEKIEEQGLEFSGVSFEDLYYLSKIMYAEAGSLWLSDDWKMAVGEVVLNRVASPEFPDTVKSVIEAPGQYYGKNSSYFANLKTTEYITALAIRLLEGERVMGNPAVVFQSNGKQGGGVFWKLEDPQLGATYFCYSNHIELYEG